QAKQERWGSVHPQRNQRQRRLEQQRKAAAAAHMNQPYQASNHDELVLMVSLDSITKIM
ncbi:unnamed protein product, partial [Urochloa humidicola]